jgi:hypothetical protein
MSLGEDCCQLEVIPILELLVTFGTRLVGVCKDTKIIFRTKNLPSGVILVKIHIRKKAQVDCNFPLILVIKFYR